MARACRANSLWCWVARVTRPVSWGRGLTSENHTWSPLTNSSTPKTPRRPLQRSGHLARRSAGAAAESTSESWPGAASFPHRSPLTSAVADRGAEVGAHLAVGRRSSGPARSVILEIEGDRRASRRSPAPSPLLRPASRAHDARRAATLIEASRRSFWPAAGGGHHRLDETGETSPPLGRPRASSAFAGGEGEGRGRQAEILGGQAADAPSRFMAVSLRGAGGGDDHRQAVRLDARLARRWRWPRSRARSGGALQLHQGAQGVRVGHGDDVGPGATMVRGAPA